MTDQYNEDKLDGILRPQIYSKRAVVVFSILFSPIFGAFMLWQNLKDIGKRNEATMALVVSILSTFLAVGLGAFLEERSKSAGMFLNIAAAFFITEYFFKKYFPDEPDYEKKKIWKPLGIGLLIIAFFVVLLMLAPPQIK